MNILGSNTGLYFYSAVFQGNMALLALVGVFVVFKLQIISGSLQMKDTEIMELIKQSFLTHGGQPIPEEIRSGFRDMQSLRMTIQSNLDDPNYRPSYRYVVESVQANSSFKYMFAEREPIAERQRRLVHETGPPFISILVVIICSLVLLPFADFIHETLPHIELYLILMVVTTNIVALIWNGKFVFRVLKN